MDIKKLPNRSHLEDEAQTIFSESHQITSWHDLEKRIREMFVEICGENGQT